MVESLIKSSNEKNLLRLLILIREFKQYINLEQSKLDISKVSHTKAFDFLEEKRLEVDILYKHYTFTINGAMQNNELIKTNLVDEARDKLEVIKKSIDEKIAF